MGIVTSCGHKTENDFYRTTPEISGKGGKGDSQENPGKYFQADAQRARILFQKGKHKLRMDEIPTKHTCYFYLRGKKQVVINPPLTGNIGFYTYLFFESISREKPIGFTMEIYNPSSQESKKSQKGTDRKIERIVSKSVSQPIFKDLELHPGDRIVLTFQGRGVAYFSDPILYKKKNFAEQKHIIFIALDTLRGDQIGALAGKDNIPLTPNIDKFIKDSLYFKNAYAQTSWTLPSFMSLFTGLYEYNHEVGIRNPLAHAKPFLIETLSQKFITFGFHGGKVMNSLRGFSRGFDSYKHFRFAGALFPKGGRSLFQKAVELLKTSHFPDLFLFLHTYQIHAPYTPPAEFLARLNKSPLYEKLDAINYNNPAKTYLPVDEDLKKSLKELYQAEILAFDSYFGEFIDELKKMNLYDNAMIVFMSDHGEEFFDHKGWGHSHSLYNELIKVPIIIKFPGSRFKDRKILDTVGVIDILPTILNYYGIKYETAHLDGRNLLPLIEKGQKRNPGYIMSSISTGRYFDAVPPKIAVLFDHYKLVYNQPFSSEDLAFFKDFTAPPEIKRFELFDLGNDPAEKQNIAYTHPDLRKKMVKLILDTAALVKQKLSKQKNKSLDKELEDQLKSLGYL